MIECGCHHGTINSFNPANDESFNALSKNCIAFSRPLATRSEFVPLIQAAAGADKLVIVRSSSRSPPDNAFDEPLWRQKLWRVLPCWLASALIHMVAILVLGLWMLRVEMRHAPLVLSATVSETRGEDHLDQLGATVDLETPEPAELPVVSEPAPAESRPSESFAAVAGSEAVSLARGSAGGLFAWAFRLRSRRPSRPGRPPPCLAAIPRP